MGVLSAPSIKSDDHRFFVNAIKYLLEDGVLSLAALQCKLQLFFVPHVCIG